MGLEKLYKNIGEAIDYDGESSYTFGLISSKLTLDCLLNYFKLHFTPFQDKNLALSKITLSFFLQKDFLYNSKHLRSLANAHFGTSS